MSAIIQVESLTKSFRVVCRQQGRFAFLRNLFSPQYQKIVAVNNVSFSINRGEIVGYLGPNGAGKSTTIKMLTGLLVPSSGKVLVDDYIPWRDREKYVSGIGVVFGQRSTLWWDLPVIDSLELLQSMYRIETNRFTKNLQNFTDLLEMGDFLQLPVRSLSLGQRMRADLCAAMLHEPGLLFLDEPTIGLDVVAKERIRRFIQYVNREKGTTILLTTHDLTDVERLCERVMIIDRGHILYDGSLQKLMNRFDDRRKLLVTFFEEYEDVQLPGTILESKTNNLAEYSYCASEISTSQVIQTLLGQFKIVDIEVSRSNLERTIHRIYEERLLDR